MAHRISAGLLGLAMLVSGTAWAEKVEIRGQLVSFAPEIVFASPGDTLAFRNMGIHLVASVDNMLPEGASPLASVMGSDYDYPLVKPGIYVYKCQIHWAAGMGGIAVVGKPADARAALEKYRGAARGQDARAKDLLDKLAAELPRHGL